MLFHLTDDEDDNIVISGDPVITELDSSYKKRIFGEMDKRDHTIMLYNIP